MRIGGNKLIVVLFFFIPAILLGVRTLGQVKIDSLHLSLGISWAGTKKVCNVCHEPFNVKYSMKQNPYWSHQVNAPTFRGNKLDGAPVLVKIGNKPDDCLKCHQRDDVSIISSGK